MAHITGLWVRVGRSFLAGDNVLEELSPGRGSTVETLQFVVREFLLDLFGALFLLPYRLWAYI